MTKRLSPFSQEFWIQKGMSPEDADYKRNSFRPIRKEYWLERGYSYEDAEKKAIQTKIDNNKKGALSSSQRDSVELRKSSPRCVEYWMERGYSYEDAKTEVSNQQSTFSLDKCIEKYGEEDGKIVWQKRQDKWQDTLNAKSDKELGSINERRGNGVNFQYLMGKFDNNRDKVKEFVANRGIKLFDTIDELKDYVKECIHNNPERRYLTQDSFCVRHTISKLQCDYLGIKPRDVLKGVLKKGSYRVKGKYNQTHMRTEEGLLRSLHEICFYDILKENSIKFDMDKNYPNSSFRYDFYLTDFDVYIEICPLYGQVGQELYTERMDKKQELFNFVKLSKSKEFEVYIRKLLDENNC